MSDSNIRLTWLACLSAVFVTAGWLRAAEPTPQQVEFFETKVRPVLAEHCYKCHSAGAKKLKAGLRLDARTLILKGGDTGPAIVPGQPDKSLLVEAIGYKNVDLQMPPKKKLPDAAIAALTQWVKLGAPWPNEATVKPATSGDEFDWKKRKASHWSWRPVRAPAQPKVKQRDWPANAIDYFILAKLEAAGLVPAADADRRTLIRRVYFDLIGLPPTPKQVDAFVNDTSANAYEKVVDELLASPHFGEKWARHWMDLVRYAETYGHEFDYPIQDAWRYRNYLIRAFNADVPYNQLVVEHIAGDLLPNPRRHPTEGFNESIIGTGFWWMHETTHAPVDVLGDEAGRIDNQITVLGKAFLGLTVGCARCHDHKFDAISTKDYYALAGFVRSSRRHEAMLDPHGRITELTGKLKQAKALGDAAIVDAAPPPNAAEFAEYLLAARQVMFDPPKAANGDALAVVAKQRALDAARLKRWVDALGDNAVKQPTHPLYVWHALTSQKGAISAEQMKQAQQRLAGQLKQRQQRADDARKDAPLIGDFSGKDYGDWFADGRAFGDAPTQPRQWDAQRRGVRAVEPGVAHSGLLATKLHGVLRSPTFTITHRNIHHRINARKAEIRLVIDNYFMLPFHTLLFNGCKLANIDTKGQYKWVTQGGDVHKYIGHRAFIEVIDHGDGFVAVDEVRQSDSGPPPDAPHPAWKPLLSGGDLKSVEDLAARYGALWAESMIQWRSHTIGADNAVLANWAIERGLFDRPTIDGKPLDARLAGVAKQMDVLSKQLPAPMPVLAMVDGTGEDDRVHIRGSHKNLGEAAPRRLIVAIAGEHQPRIEHGSGRLELAKRITDPGNPFASRVMVNRVWHHLFGRGIVPSVDDFGVMGQRPTHPELLDWLASDFIRNGWSIKRVIRLCVLSRTYRMSSKPAQMSADPQSAARNPQSVDPANELLHRMRIRRLPAESLRDAVLAVSGRLDRKLFGPSVAVHLTPFMEGRGRPRSGPLDGDGRRSLYIEVRRNFLTPMLLAFDFPSPFSTMGRRSVSNVPAQALIMMNDPFIVQQAQVWAKRVLAESADFNARITNMYETAFARPPTDAELAKLKGFIASQAALYNTNSDDPRVWTDVAHVLLNMKEFLFLN